MSTKNVDDLAMCAARVLSKFGSHNPDWTEWRELKDALLKIQSELDDKYVQNSVGYACSAFNVELSEVLKGK